MTSGLAYHPIFLEHRAEGHPERPQRLTAIRDYLQATGLWSQLASWLPEPVDQSTLRLLHSQRMIDQVRNVAESGGGWLDADTFVSPQSFDAALVAAGGAVEAATRTLAGDLTNALVLPRPPGHHATPERAVGFCLFNNVALAAARAIRDRLAQRVYIVDLDVHHGNGTQDCFYDRSDVLFFSVHQHPFYPGTGLLAERGVGEGLGYTLNLPLPAGCGDATYARAASEVIVPLGEWFKPDLVLVSLGFDAFWDDPLAGMRLSIAGYSEVLGQVRDLAARECSDRLVVVLEGGYNLRALAFGIAAAAHLLLGEPVPAELALPAPPRAEPQEAGDVLLAVRKQAGL